MRGTVTKRLRKDAAKLVIASNFKVSYRKIYQTLKKRFYKNKKV